MNEQPMDPRIDRMVAALYGELPEAEQRAFRRLLEKDDELRAEFEELQASRDILSGWRVEERVPSFVLVDGAKREDAPGWWARLAQSLRGFSVSPAWGLAATAATLLVLALAGLRIEPLGNGIAFRLGEPTTPEMVGAGRPLEVGARTARPATALATSTEYLTQEEFAAYNQQLMQSLVLLLNDYDTRREQEITGLIRTVYDRMNTRQVYDVEQLNRRLDALGTELVIDRNLYVNSLDDLLRNSPRTEPASLELSPASEPKE